MTRPLTSCHEIRHALLAGRELALLDLREEDAFARSQAGGLDSSCVGMHCSHATAPCHRRRTSAISERAGALDPCRIAGVMLSTTSRNAGIMRNPWTSKNPFMSMWLSAANTTAASARGVATAAAKRQVASAQADAMRQFLDFWAPKPAPARSRKKARR